MALFKPSDEQWYAMCDAHMSSPVPLRDADTTKPFVYDRDYGLFYVPFGYHQQAMALLLTFRRGLDRAYAAAEELGFDFDPIAKLADHWLMTIPGTCYKSSQGSEAQCAKPEHLTAAELRLIGNVRFLSGPAQSFR